MCKLGEDFAEGGPRKVGSTAAKNQHPGSSDTTSFLGVGGQRYQQMGRIVETALCHAARHGGIKGVRWPSLPIYPCQTALALQKLIKNAGEQGRGVDVKLRRRIQLNMRTDEIPSDNTFRDCLLKKIKGSNDLMDKPLTVSRGCHPETSD